MIPLDIICAFSKFEETTRKYIVLAPLLVELNVLGALAELEVIGTLVESKIFRALVELNF